jgi:hypothetical protein
MRRAPGASSTPPGPASRTRARTGRRRRRRRDGAAFIARDRDGRTLVRVVDRHPADAWDDVSRDALASQLARAYVPPVGWVERHGGTGTSRRPGSSGGT